MIYDFVMDSPNISETDKNVLMQFTGLKDKNGVDIYEDDILTANYYPFQDDGERNYDGIMKWDDDTAGFYLEMMLVNKNKRGISDGISESIDAEMMKDFEVIGNIYEKN